MHQLINAERQVYHYQNLKFSNQALWDQFETLWSYLDQAAFLCVLQSEAKQHRLCFIEKIRVAGADYLSIREEDASVLAQHHIHQRMHDINNAFTTVLVWAKLLEKDKDQLSDSNQAFLKYGSTSVDKMKLGLKNLQELELAFKDLHPIAWQDSFFEMLGIELLPKQKMFNCEIEEAYEAYPLNGNFNTETSGIAVAPLSDLAYLKGTDPCLFFEEKPSSLALIASLQQVAFVAASRQKSSQVSETKV